MTDYSQLPLLNPIAPQHEEPWLRLPPWRMLLRALIVLWSWVNLAVISLFLTSVCSAYIHGSSCGNSYSPLHETIPRLIALNLALWGISKYLFPQYSRWIKLPTLLSIMLWSSIVGGFWVRMSLPDFVGYQAQQGPRS